MTCITERPVPAHVAIVGLGPSAGTYLEIVKRLGGRHRAYDEVWTINAMGGVFACDRVFHMDDVRIQQVRADAAPRGNIAVMLEWLKRHPGPVYTSRAHPDYPGLVPYPLAAVLDGMPEGYMNGTAAHAVAFAVHLGVRKISCFGMDFTYAHAHSAEKGRACVEFWLGVAAARGIQLAIPQSSSLMDACEKGCRYYGYDTLDLEITRKDGHLDIVFSEKPGPLPSADEIERRYDHNAHPNPLVETR